VECEHGDARGISMTFGKIFLAVFLAIMVAVGTIYAIWEIDRNRKTHRAVTNFLFTAAIDNEGTNWELRHADEDPEGKIWHRRAELINEAAKRGDKSPPNFPNEYTAEEYRANGIQPRGRPK
jgi:hypothetical protein